MITTIITASKHHGLFIGRLEFIFSFSENYKDFSVRTLSLIGVDITICFILPIISTTPVIMLELQGVETFWGHT